MILQVDPPLTSESRPIPTPIRAGPGETEIPKTQPQPAGDSAGEQPAGEQLAESLPDGNDSMVGQESSSATPLSKHATRKDRFMP